VPVLGSCCALETEGIASISTTLSGWLCGGEIPTEERPKDERDIRAMELAKREVVDAARIGDAWCEGAECITTEILLDRSSTSSAPFPSDIWLRDLEEDMLLLGNSMWE
jgi:hypothetical protein